MPDGQAARLGERRDELVRPRCGSSAPDGSWRRTRAAPSSGSFFACSSELLRLPAAPGAVDEAGVELAVGRGDRLARLAQVLDVVQRVVQAEDVDAALGRAGDEPAREVAADGVRADEEAAAKRHAERRLRPRLERADPLPRALDAAPDGAVEDAAAGNLEVREPGPVEELGESRRSAVGMRPASGSWLSRRIVVSTSAGTPEGNAPKLLGTAVAAGAGCRRTPTMREYAGSAADALLNERRCRGRRRRSPGFTRKRARERHAREM